MIGDDQKYFIYDKNEDKYIEVDDDYIISHPNAKYYAERQIVDDLAQLNNRVNRLDEVIGYAYYDNVTYSYTYSGMIYDVDSLKQETTGLSRNIMELWDEFYGVSYRSTVAYDTSKHAYGMAYFAYELSLLGNAYALDAYIMAYNARETIGHEHIDAYFRPLNNEEIEALMENPYSIPVYGKQVIDGTEYYVKERVFDINTYNNNPSYYYVYIEPEDSTGFYKTLEEYNTRIDNAQYTADNILFNLNSTTYGTEAAYLDIIPKMNDGSNARTIQLNVTEAEIDENNGEILSYGFITTYSLASSFSYYSKFVILE